MFTLFLRWPQVTYIFEAPGIIFLAMRHGGALTFFNPPPVCLLFVGLPLLVCGLLLLKSKHDGTAVSLSWSESPSTKKNSNTPKADSHVPTQDPKGRGTKPNRHIAELNHCLLLPWLLVPYEGTAVGLSYHEQRRKGNTPGPRSKLPSKNKHTCSHSGPQRKATKRNPNIA